MKKLSILLSIVVISASSAVIAAESVYIPSAGQNPSPTSIAMPGNAQSQALPPLQGSQQPQQVIYQAPAQTTPQQPAYYYPPQQQAATPTAPQGNTVVVTNPNRPAAPIQPAAPQQPTVQAPVAQAPQPTPLMAPAQPQQPVQPLAAAPQQPVAPQAAPVSAQPVAIVKPAEQVPEPSTMVANAPSMSSPTLYTLATISGTVPQGKASLPKGIYKTMDDDSWKQIEFVPASNRAFMDNQLQQVVIFKQQNWAGNGFRNVMERLDEPTTLEAVKYPASRLKKAKTIGLRLKSGTVSDGFAVEDPKTAWFLYGQKNKAGVITSLAVSPDSMPPSDTFTKILAEIAGTDLIMVDWYRDQIVDTSSAKSISDWAYGYKPADMVSSN